MQSEQKHPGKQPAKIRRERLKVTVRLLIGLERGCGGEVGKGD